MEKRYFGCHVSVSGGLANGLRNGKELGVNTIQIHPTPPQRWNSRPFETGIEAEFLKELKNCGVEKVFLHAIYLINLANPDPQKNHLSKVSLVNYLDLCGRLQAAGVVFHVGSNKDQENDLEGIKLAAGGVNWILQESSNKARLLLEVSAGSGKVIGSKLEQLASVYQLINKKERVGFALDTQHMWASGYDFVGALEDVVAQVETNFGLDRVALIHLNDSKTALASKVDRHANLGEGLIGIETLRQIVQHPKLKNIPVVLETPALKDLESAKGEVKTLRELLAVS